MQFLPAIAAAAGPALASIFGNRGQQQSGFSKGQQGGIQGILNTINQIKAGGGGMMNIENNPAYGQGMEWLQSMFNDPEFFSKFEAPMMRQFQEQTVPELANRFASMGSGGSTGSTGFRNQLAREGSNLSTNIAALRGGMQQNAIPQLLGYAQQPFQNVMSMYNQALGQPVNNQYQPPSAGPLGGPAAAFSGSYLSGFGQQMGQNMAGGNQQQNQQRPPGQSPLTY